MNYAMTKPCPQCPFLKTRATVVRPTRAREIGSMMLDSQGGVFPCHKTVDYAARGDDDDDHGPSLDPDEVHCAGALIFAEKQGRATQMMRVCERLGLYDHAKLDRASFPLVWDSLAQWVKASRAALRTIRGRGIGGGL